VLILTIGVVFNEAVLAVQGIGAFSYTIIPYVNEILFGIAIILFIGIVLTAIYSIKKVKNNPPL
jgi:ABC-type nitrate/sulfonate/bicarbonate transport system permease component